MLTYLYVAIGGAVGSIARFAVSGAIARGLDEIFPWGTLIVNISGCFLIGLFATLTAANGRFPAALDTRTLLMVGICGGYTTFSSFGLQTLNLIRDGDMLRASLNIVGSVVLCLVGVWLGSALGVSLNQMKSA